MALLQIAWLDPFRDGVSEGNSRYNDKKYLEAKKRYDKAEKYAPGEKDKQKLAFNRADANYMAGDLEAAIAGYKKAIQSGDPDVQKKAFFNLGNAYLQQKKYREAFNAFRNALKIDPNYAPAKRNIEYMLSKQKKNQQKDKNKKDSDKNNQQKQDQKNQDKNKDKKNQKKEQNKNQKQNQQKNKQKQQMNRQQLKNLLKSMKNKPVRRQKGRGNEKRNLDKDW